MRYLSMKKQKKANIDVRLCLGAGVVSDDGLEPPTYAV
jgi:hypothetical protein